jgi:hypothetical protein
VFITLTPAFLATQKVEIRKTVIQSQPRQKVPKIPFQPKKKAKSCGLCLSFQLCGKHKQEDQGPDLSRHKCKTLSPE